MKGIGKHSESGPAPRRIIPVGDDVREASLDDGLDRNFRSDGVSGVGAAAGLRRTGKKPPFSSGHFRGEEPLENIRVEAADDEG